MVLKGFYGNYCKCHVYQVVSRNAESNIKTIKYLYHIMTLYYQNLK